MSSIELWHKAGGQASAPRGWAVNVSDMLGEVFTSVRRYGDELVFTCAYGEVAMYHRQECCESVELYDVVGDLDDLVGEPLLLAEESSGDSPSDFTFDYEPESYTWTYYKFATRKGYVDLRWLGTSNGYYSESVSLWFKPNTATL